jgi:hypothetical protein
MMYHNGINSKTTKLNMYMYMWLRRLQSFFLRLYGKRKSYVLIEEICPARHSNVVKGVT